ncbi:MAG: hypothetical protein ACFNXY_12165 [Corynebacterium matruchotii]|uniref:YobI family P-loop NTPase n=1 Tax=Corynebacterium matruchotii TaxID=43768 RepID=UPI00360E12C4
MSTDPDSQQEVSNPEASQQPDQGDKSIDKKSDDVADSPDQEKQSSDASSELIVLSPHFDEKHHGLYVKKLEQAVRNPKVRNIALTGGYGTGKSSVIQGLIERIHSSKELEKIRPITISLPTIQVVNESDSKDNRTDRIQREIVKQLLYRSEPRKMRRSQYRRITHITTVQRAIACFIIAIFLTFTFWLLAKPDWHWSQGGSLWGYWQPTVVQTILWGLTFYIDWTWVNKPTIAIKGLQLGPAKLELEKNDFNYFDKYLNEIIYYFEVSKTNLVIFEDLDRFDDPYIFDALHELNELINISLGQERFTEQKNPPVRFLYTIRDSIFEYKTQGIIKNVDTRYTHRLEIENRTKFFDVIVPIIPFSTSRNAYEYLTQLLNDHVFPAKIETEQKLREIVGSEVSDYRLLKNIVSEFQIFTERISVSWDGNSEAKDFLRDHANYLFAFVVYKNTHFIDYEKLQTEDSNIDKINKDFLSMRENIRKKIEKLFDELAHDLKSFIERINSYKKIDMRNYILSVNDEDFYNFATIELWSKALSFDPYTSMYPKILLIYRDEEIPLPNSIFVDLMKNRIEDSDCILSFGREINDLQKIISTINAIMEISNISSLLSLEYSMLPTEMWQIIDGFRNSFQEKFNHDIITQKLIQQNYINENFYIYSSIFTQGALANITSIAANANTPPAMRTA